MLSFAAFVVNENGSFKSPCAVSSVYCTKEWAPVSLSAKESVDIVNDGDSACQSDSIL